MDALNPIRKHSIQITILFYKTINLLLSVIICWRMRITRAPSISSKTRISVPFNINAAGSITARISKSIDTLPHLYCFYFFVSNS